MLDQIRAELLEIAPDFHKQGLHVVDLDETDLRHIDAGGIADNCSTENWAHAEGWKKGDVIIAGRVADYPDPRVLRSTLYHEAGHPLAEKRTPRSVMERIRRGSLSKAKFDMYEGKMESPNRSPFAVIQHHTGFVRSCCHLYGRALLKGYEIAGEEMLNYWWLSSIDVYLPLFFREVVENLDKPFFELFETPLPAGVADRWGRDAAKFNQVYGPNKTLKELNDESA